MMTTPEPLPADLAEAHAMIIAERAGRLAAEAEAAIAKQTKRVLDLEIERLKLEIARLRRQRFGTSSERSARLEQLELALTELQETVAQADAAAELRAAERSPTPARSTAAPRKPARRALPEHLPRTRLVYPAPTACPCCGGAVRKLGEEITETLERLPARWLVVQHVREKVSCRCCEAIREAPAPFHPIARGRAGPNLLAEVVFGKYGMHLPLNRQSACFACEGIELDVSTLADWVGAVAASLQPLTAAIEAHVRAAARIHADETPVPVLAKGKTKEGRLWTVVRDDRPFGGPHLDGTGPPAAVFFYSPDRSGVHAERFLAGWTGIMQADAFSGFGRLYKSDRRPGPITEAGCWAHGRRGFFELAELQQGPIAIEAVKRIDALFAIEREINGASAEQRLAVRNQRSRPLILDLEAWLRDQNARLSAKSKTAKAIDYLLKRWTAFTRFLDDGRVCLSNNAAERALRGIAVGRRNWTFAGSDEGGRRAAAMYTLIETAKLNGIDPRAWLASVLARLPGHPTSRIHELLPWNWQAPEPISTAA
ncbi:MAG: IS66 family transposase [Rhodospirillales bacterium]|nr:IS66 family transposase [Rhodospirillales bacterium]